MPNKKTSITENPELQELIAVLKKNKSQNHLKELNAVIGKISSLENQLESVTNQLEAVSRKLEEMTDAKKPVPETFKKMIESTKNKLAEIQNQLNEMKQSLIDAVKRTLETLKQTGFYALDKTTKFLRVKDGLEAIGQSLAKAENGVKNAVTQLDRLDEKAQKPSLLNKVSENKSAVKKSAPAVSKARKQEAAI